MTGDMELQRIDDEFRRLEEKRKKLIERRLRRQRQIREKQLKDKDAWMRKLIPLLDRALQERFGPLYWYGLEAEDVCRVAGGMELERQDPGSEGLDPAVEEQDPGVEGSDTVEKEKEDLNEDKGRDERHR